MPDPNDYFQFNITHPEPKPPRLGRANLFWSTDADSLVIQLPGMSPATIGGGGGVSLTAGPVRSLGVTSSIANNALTIAMTSGLQSALNAKQSTVTTDSLSISMVENLQSALDARAILPSQASHNGKFLKTDGTVTSWGVPVVSGDITVDSVISTLGAEFQSNVLFNDCTFSYSGAALANLKTSLAIGTEVAVADLSIDWSAGDLFRKTLSTSSTFTFDNLSNKTIRVAITNTASEATTWPGGIVWQGGSIPTPTAAKTDIYTFTRSNGVIYGSALLNF